MLEFSVRKCVFKTACRILINSSFTVRDTQESKRFFMEVFGTLKNESILSTHLLRLTFATSCIFRIPR
jgi:hypothetical protein